jgi:site-specific recombinase XerD
MQIHDAILLVSETCNRQHLSVNTEKAYTHWVRRFGLFLKGGQFRSASPERKMEAFPTKLAGEGVSASTQNQAFNALLFFYREGLKLELGPVDALRAKRSATLRECPNRQDVDRLLAAVNDLHGYPTRLIVHLLYACGLRVTEPLNLRIKDLDLSQSRLHIRQAKGDKDRVVPFPACLGPALERQLALAKALAAQDRDRGIPVPLPGLLAKKYPGAPLSERWAWLFPARSTCQDPRTGEQVRWRCHEANVQRAVKQAVRACHLDGLTAHCLRHAYATHSLQNGAFVRDVQVVLGHTSLETTMGYLHPEISRVASPLQEYVPKSGPVGIGNAK